VSINELTILAYHFQIPVSRVKNNTISTRPQLRHGYSWKKLEGVGKGDMMYSGRQGPNVTGVEYPSISMASGWSGYYIGDVPGMHDPV
jgi:hypothetical protein